jgi:putative MATE family efflux protein
MAIVGHYLGEGSMAAIGASAVVFEMLVGFAIGVGGGFGIVAARSYGAADEGLLRRTVAGAIVIGGALTVFISVAGSLFMRPLLRLLDTPPEIIDEAHDYIFVLIAFALVFFIYNLCAGLLRAVGNSRTPLYFLMLSSLLNIVFDIIFIVYFRWGLSGVAAATIAAQGISAVLCLVYIYRKCPILVPRREDFRYNAALYRELAAQGFSMGLMMSIVSLGSVVLQRAINGLGYLVIAGHVAARRINLVFVQPIVALTFAISTFVSQNKGAGQLERIRKGMRYANITAVAWGVFAAVFLLFTAPFFIRLLSGSEEMVVIENGARYLRINSPFYMVLGLLFNFRYALQGIGMKIIPIMSSIIELIGKIIFAFLLVHCLTAESAKTISMLIAFKPSAARETVRTDVIAQPKGARYGMRPR